VKNQQEKTFFFEKFFEKFFLNFFFKQKIFFLIKEIPIKKNHPNRKKIKIIRDKLFK